ncbi:recombinase family protein [Gimesia benthica]|uniref:Recombinase family protein n=1 Tax=Gimesia benthica TaxID=2608982 RepID=A0A6I6AI27_9PLAN|nr:recombinase family protein [Gimesia benthica]QGQ24731.1 recombinase family protein [Gimesia benthica]
MLKTKFGRNPNPRVVIYARMSSSRQNPRSPEQQIDTITDTLKRLGLNWQVVAVYRDDAISGRYFRKRPGFQKMLRELKSGVIRAEYVLVDTFERLSRAENNAEIRRMLVKAGALVLTADSQFADPNSVPGRALSFMETYRASEECRVKAHNVLRGKKDAIRQGKWPGGSPPFGFFLKNVMVVRNGVEELDHRVLIPIPEQKWIVELIFTLSAQENLGPVRICKKLNNHPDIPSHLSPFTEATVASILRNELYYGEMVWGKNCTGIEDDVRVLQSIPEEEWEVNSEFCEAIITKELWQQSMQMIESRRHKVTQPDLDGQDAAHSVLRPSGVALKYPLSGLVVCSSCGRAMVSSASSAYTTKAGEVHSYASYGCPAYRSGACDNDRRVPESWLRETVIQLVKDRLFPH